MVGWERWPSSQPASVPALSFIIYRSPDEHPHHRPKPSPVRHCRKAISFGDKVRVRETTETTEIAEYAGLAGVALDVGALGGIRVAFQGKPDACFYEKNLEKM